MDPTGTLVNAADNPAGTIQAVNSANSRTLIFIGIVLVLYVAYQLLTKAMANRKQQRAADTDAKGERARITAETARFDRMAGALETMAATIRDHTEHDTKMLDHIAVVLTGMESTVGSLHESIARLVQQTSGQMSRANSLRMIKTAFLKSIRTDAIDVAIESLTENHYESRQLFVFQRVSTRLGDAVTEARAELRSYPLAVDVDPFFRIYQQANGGDRYELVDLLWKALEPLYKASGTARERSDEVELLFENVIKDYFSRCFSELRQVGESMPTTILEGLARGSMTPPMGQQLPTRFITPRPE